MSSCAFLTKKTRLWNATKICLKNNLNQYFVNQCQSKGWHSDHAWYWGSIFEPSLIRLAIEQAFHWARFRWFCFLLNDWVFIFISGQSKSSICQWSWHYFQNGEKARWKSLSQVFHIIRLGIIVIKLKNNCNSEHIIV